MQVFTFPGKYYSRPYPVGNDIWVFENTIVSSGDIYIFDARNLKLKKRIRNPEWIRNGGAFRCVHDDIVVFSPNAAFEKAIIWKTSLNRIKTLSLGKNKQVLSAKIHKNFLYLGDSSGEIHCFMLPEAVSCKGYSQGTESVEQGNECIKALHIYSGKLIAAGEAHFFIWDMESRAFLGRKKKRLPASVVLFWRDRACEFAGKDIRVSTLFPFKQLAGRKSPFPIHDLVITPNKILPDTPSPVILASLGKNRGIRAYNGETLALVSGLDIPGDALSVVGENIFATDDTHIYRFSLSRKNRKKFLAFLGNLDKEKVPLSNPFYYPLIAVLQKYPEVLRETGISRAYLKKLGISLSYETTGVVSSKKQAHSVRFTLKNHTPNRYLVKLCITNEGFYVNEPDWFRKSGMDCRSFFIRDNGVFAGEFALEDGFQKKPVIFAQGVKPVDQKYMEGFYKSMDIHRASVSEIDLYLKEPLLSDWHPELERIKHRIKKKNSWFNLFHLFSGEKQ